MSRTEKARELVSQMTLEEKASLCSGANFWETKPIERLGIPKIMVTDGPHGLRKQDGSADNLGIAQSVPATCFPTACATACTFDRNLLEEIGRAIGEECLQEEVAVVLGPGVNIKRSPLCGRNFEYFSEDPLLGGELAAAMINGIQETGVGACVKHYAANNQETRRMTIDVVADERALREIYLKSFEIPVRKAKPWTLMCSYNKIGGTYASDNKRLLTDVPRGEWGFDGLIMTDWGAMNDRVKAALAGCDLEMPGSGGVNDAKLVSAVRDGRLNEEDVDKLAVRVVETVLKAKDGMKKDFRYDADAHHALARRAAAESCVLLKNEDDILPLKKESKLAVIGSFAKSPRYQGTGSSKIVPSRMDCAYDELVKLGFEAAYCEGYGGLSPDQTLVDEAVNAAREADTVLIFAGLPDEYESEGFDRKSLSMPESHVNLIKEVSKANPNVAVILQLGAPALTDWATDVKGLLVSYLGGQAGGGGVADVLAGVVCPGGKLAESWPLALEYNPSFYQFPGYKKTTEYRESIFVGYRYYETADRPVAWPFGFGLSYASFEYANLKLNEGEVVFNLTNAGSVEGAEAVQIYLSMPKTKIIRPRKWLAAFDKIKLAPGETKSVSIRLDEGAFKYFNTAANGWRTEGGEYAVCVGSSVSDIRLTGLVNIQGDGDEALLASQTELGYFKLTGNNFNEADFAALCGRPLPQRDRKQSEPFTVNDTLGDIKHTKIGKRILGEATKKASENLGLAGGDVAKMVDAMLLEMPLRSLGMMGGGSLPPNFAELLVATLNGNYFKRTLALIKFGAAMSKASKKIAE